MVSWNYCSVGAWSKAHDDRLIVDTRSEGHGLLLQNSEKGGIVSFAEIWHFSDNKEHDKKDENSTDCRKWEVFFEKLGVSHAKYYSVETIKHLMK